MPDVGAAVRALDKAGLGPVYIWGQSLGAGVAAAACADETLPVRGLVLLRHGTPCRTRVRRIIHSFRCAG